eukprot:SM000211S06636  [mRNA]  locus=s211:138809:142350:+ [translate_table: standard]
MVGAALAAGRAICLPTARPLVGAAAAAQQAPQGRRLLADALGSGRSSAGHLAARTTAPSLPALPARRVRAMASLAVDVKDRNGGLAGAPPLTDAKALIDSVETFLFDCDGVIWKGDKLIEGVPETLDFLRSQGKRLIFVTNNSTKSREQYGKKFKTLGLNVTKEEIFASSFAAAAYLKFKDFPADKKARAPICLHVYVVGEAGIQLELDLAGITHIGGPEDGTKAIDLAPGKYMEHDEDVAAVVVGFDRNINYYKLQYATLCIRENPNCQFIATNCDAVTHLTDAQEWAGGGSMVGAIRGSTKKEPTVVGKPSTFMMDYLAKEFGISKSQICMVGDRLDTDILFGQNGGCRTLLVLSGVTTLDVLQSPENQVHPEFYADDITALLKAKTKVAA